MLQCVRQPASLSTRQVLKGLGESDLAAPIEMYDVRSSGLAKAELAHAGAGAQAEAGAPEAK